jgi:hypothetical protein
MPRRGALTAAFNWRSESVAGASRGSRQKRKKLQRSAVARDDFEKDELKAIAQQFQSRKAQLITKVA